MRRRLLAILLTGALVVCLLPGAALAAGTTATPTTADAAATKTNIIQTSLTYTLTNNPAYAAGTVFHVYTDANKSAYATGVTATLSGSTLTLTHTSNLPVGKLYVTATESGKTESAVLEVAVKVTTGKVVMWRYNDFGWKDPAVRTANSNIISYYRNAGVTVDEVLTNLADNSLNGVSLLIVWMPLSSPTASEMAQMQALMDNGGRIFVVCEHNN